MPKKLKPSIRYYSWEGDACRVMEDEMGNLDADIYRAGVGTLPVKPYDVIDNSRQISEEKYKEIVLKEIEYHKKKTGQ